MKQQFYITGDYLPEDNNLISEIPVYWFSLEYVRDPLQDIADLASKNRVILGMATLTDETREAFIESVKTAGIPENLRRLNIEIQWPYDNDYAEFMEAGCQKYGISEEELERIREGEADQV